MSECKACGKPLMQVGGGHRKREYCNTAHRVLMCKLRRYGLSIASRQELIQAGCKICGRTDRRMCVDHDHKTDMFRGILCNFCNTMLGYFKDDTSVLQNAIAYLQENREALHA